MARRKRYPRRRRQQGFSVGRILRQLRRRLLRLGRTPLLICLAIVAVWVVRRVWVSHRIPSRYTITATDYNGIDVSHHQGNIDWAQVAGDSHIQFVYIKATEGSTHTDRRYRQNITAARAAGLPVGSYHFFLARRPAADQFDNFCRHVDASQQDLLPMVDVEESGCRGVSRGQLQRNLQQFMDLVRDRYGHYPLLYSQYRFYNTMLAPEFNRYYIMMARYGRRPPVLHGTGRYNIWQYTERGRVSGIRGYVDLDRFDNGTTLSDIKL